MAEDKTPFEDEFNTDEFDAFDNDDFHFDDDDDDDDDDPFQLDISEDDTENEDESPYQFSEDESEDTDEDVLESPEIEKTQPQDKFNPTVLLQNLIEHLKNEEPKQLIKYGIGAFIVLLFLIGGLMKLISPSPKTATTTAATQANSLLNPANSTSGINTPIANLPQGNLNTADFNAPNDAQSSQNSLASLNNPTPVNPAVATPSPTLSSQPSSTAMQQPVVTVNPAEMQQAATQNSSLTNHINQLDAQVAQLTQQVTADAQMNSSNQAQIATLIKSIESMQSQMARLNNAMQTIVAAVNQAGNRQSGFVSGNSNFNNSPSMQTAPDYYVQAVIPGRAWLKSSNGQIITVTTGDGIPGYGTVETIDSQNGVVITSTGTKIVFGIDEG